ncbi:MAG: efflux RND transporter permease subunit [Phycisphaeraceae bacterium]
MISKLIDWCIHNRAMVLLLTLFLVAASMWAVFTIKLDAIPDLSDVQVVIRTEYPGQAPQIVEDQVTYPLTTAMLQVPYAKVVRGYSMFGTSFVYVIFEDGTDLYWARSRVLEQLNFVSARLPQDISPQLGPDATGVGWVYQYALITGKYCADHPNGLWQDPLTEKWYADPAEAPEEEDVRARLVRHRVFTNAQADAKPQAACPLDGKPLVDSAVTLAELRSIQDWYLRYELTAVNGVSEVAPIGGMVKQYQVTVDPVKLLAYKLPLAKVRSAIARSNLDVGGRLIEQSETEYMVRGLGYLGALTDQELDEARAAHKSIGELRTNKALSELRQVALGVSGTGSPIYLGDVAEVRIGPDIRRGVADWNGQGETVGGIIVMRFGENARTTIHSVKTKLAELEKGLPPGVGIEIAYDRSDLIDRAVQTLSHTLIEEIIVVGLVCILFLLHARSELVAVFVVPTGVLASILLMRLLGINANVMSLGGIAIAIGVMVDSSIIMVENSHKHLDREEERLHELAKAGQTAEPRPRTTVIAEAAKEVGPSLFFALLIITVSFLPIFVLGEQSGRLFRPLAFTKTFAMGAAAFLAVTVIPVLMTLLISARVLPKRWGWPANLAITLAAMLLPAALLLVDVRVQTAQGPAHVAIPLGPLEAYRPWVALAWAVLMAMLLVPQKIIHENANPISWVLQGIYHPLFVLAMRFRWLVLIGATLAVLSIAYPFLRMGSEFMPPLEEGDLLYMPTTDPGISVTKARELLSQTDLLIKQFPEVQSVFGKIGRAETATDPAPPSMFETTITLQRDKHKWRHVPVERFYRNWPGWLRSVPEMVWSSTRPITVDQLLYGYDLPNGSDEPIRVPGLNDTVQIPGLTNSWTMPIRTRIDMLSTGIKTPVGIKVMGPDLKTLADLANQIAQVIKTAQGTGSYTTSAFPEKSVGGNYLDVRLNREEIARYGLTIGDVQDVIMTAMGGMNISQTVEGLERYPINLRYPQELRDNIEALKQTLVATPTSGGGAQVPLGQLADFDVHKGPPMVKSENARLTSWVFVDIAGIDVGTYVANAQKAVASQVTLPPGYSIVWSGQYEYMQAARARLKVVVPLAGVLVVLLLYLSMNSWLRVALVLTAVPFSLVGAFWLVYLLDYNMSVAVIVGLIALAGLDAETGMVMLLYLDTSFDRFTSEGRMRNRDDLWHAVHDGAVKRIRPKIMTVATTFIGLVPLLWAQGAGADTMRRLAVPMIGGLSTSVIMELLVYPTVFYLAKSWAMRKQFQQ